MSHALPYNPLMEAAQLTAVRNQARTGPVRMSFGSVAAREAFVARLSAGLCTPLAPETPVLSEGAMLTFMSA